MNETKLMHIIRKAYLAGQRDAVEKHKSWKERRTTFQKILRETEETTKGGVL